MKTDYRGIFCIVAWLCYVAVECRKDTFGLDNFERNGIEDFGRENDGDDELTFLGKAYDKSKVLKDESEEGDGEKKCGEDCTSTGGTCTAKEDNLDVLECICPPDMVLEETKCIDGEKKCGEDCTSTGGTCTAKGDNLDVIECICPPDMVLEKTKCIDNDEKCDADFPNCKTTGGSCLSSANVLKCECPEGTTLKDTKDKCEVEDAKCDADFPNCKTTGGACDPSLCTADDLFRANVICLEKQVDDPLTQINGIVAILDMKFLGFHHIRHFSPSHALKIVSLVQDSFPARFKAIHIVNEPALFDIILAIVKPLISEKLKKRIYAHGSNMSSLHVHIPPEILPAEYEGQLGPYNNSTFIEALGACEEMFIQSQMYRYISQIAEKGVKKAVSLDTFSSYRHVCIR